MSDNYGVRAISTIGLLIGTTGFFAMYDLGANTPYYLVALVLCIIGVGNGMFSPPNVASIMSSVPANRVGVAAGFRNTTFNVSQTTSYGLLILFMTLGISYGHLSDLIQGVGGQIALGLARLEFFHGMRIAVLILGSLNAAAILPSVLRGQKKPDTSLDE